MEAFKDLVSLLEKNSITKSTEVAVGIANSLKENCDLTRAVKQYITSSYEQVMFKIYFLKNSEDAGTRVSNDGRLCYNSLEREGYYKLPQERLLPRMADLEAQKT